MRMPVSLLLLTLIFPSIVFSATIGNFQQQCHAPNWITGKTEIVEEVNVYQRASDPVLGFTRRMPNGHWRTEYNVDRIRYFNIPPDVMVFLFYHECAHAKMNSESEAVADCVALSDMQTDGYLSDETYKRIEVTYQRFGRTFPSGVCR